MNRPILLILTGALVAVGLACSGGDAANPGAEDGGAQGDDGSVGDGSIGDGSPPRDGGLDARDATTGCPIQGCIVQASVSAYYIATDGMSIYWLSGAGVYKSPVSGGAPTLLAPLGSGQTFANGLALHGDHLFWTAGAASLSLGLVQSVLNDGGSLTRLAPSDQNGLGITADDTNAYWQDLGGLKRSNPDGGTPFLMNATSPGSNPFVVGGTVYWARTAVVGTPASGSGGAPLTGNYISGLSQIAADTTHVYVFEANSGTISSVSVGGGDASTIATAGSTGVYAITTDSTNVYYITNRTGNPTDGYIAKAPLGGGASIKIASGFQGGSSIAVDNTSVYWVDLGSIRRAPK